MTQTTAHTIGQRVAYSLGGSYAWEAYNLRFDTVDRITPSGQIVLTNGMKFNSDGNQMKTKTHTHPRSFLVQVDRADRLIAHDRMLKEQHKISEKAQQCIKNIGSQQTLKPDQIAALQAVIAAFSTPTE